MNELWNDNLVILFVTSIIWNLNKNSILFFSFKSFNLNFDNSIRRINFLSPQCFLDFFLMKFRWTILDHHFYYCVLCFCDIIFNRAPLDSSEARVYSQYLFTKLVFVHRNQVYYWIGLVNIIDYVHCSRFICIRFSRFIFIRFIIRNREIFTNIMVDGNYSIRTSFTLGILINFSTD